MQRTVEALHGSHGAGEGLAHRGQAQRSLFATPVAARQLAREGAHQLRAQPATSKYPPAIDGPCTPRYRPRVGKRTGFGVPSALHHGVAPLLACGLAFTLGCVDAAAPAASAGVPAVKTRSGANRTPARGDAAPATSLGQAPPAARYLDLGVPAVDRPWSERDYVRANNVLSALEDAELPRLHDPDSIPVLRRIADPSNLTPLQDTTLPLHHRMRAAGRLLLGVNAINQRYVAAASKDPSFFEENVYLKGFLLHLAVVVQTLTDELLQTLDSKDPGHGPRMEGLEQIKSGLARAIHAAIEMVADRESVSPLARRRFSGILAASLPKVVSSLEAGTRAELRATLSELADSEADPEVQANLRQAARPAPIDAPAANSQKPVPTIPHTRVLDTRLNREVVAFMESYRRAVEALDVEALADMVSDRYLDDQGTSTPSDDVDAATVRASLRQLRTGVSKARYQISYRGITDGGDGIVFVDALYTGWFGVDTGGEELQWQRQMRLTRFVLAREGSQYKFLSGM